MKKIKIKIIKIGHLPIKFRDKKILNWKSKLFEIIGNIENYTLPTDSDGLSWEFTDQNLRSVIRADESVDFTIAITNVRLEDNYYSRRISSNIAVLTFYEMKNILQSENIPLENILFRIIYAYYLVYVRFQKFPDMETRNFTHDDTRGCLFDMTPTKEEVVYSCFSPVICSDCEVKFQNNGVSIDILKTAKNEIRKIKKELFYSLVDSFKTHPIASFLIIVAISTIISELIIRFLLNPLLAVR